MDQHDFRGTLQYRRPKDFSWMDQGRVHGANTHVMHADHAQAGIQGDDQAMLAAEVLKMLHMRQQVPGRANPDTGRAGGVFLLPDVQGCDLGFSQLKNISG